MSKVYVIIRTIGESTLSECIKAVDERGLAYGVLKDYRPLEKASKMTLQIGSFMFDYDWILALDADVILTASKKDIEEYCAEMEKIHYNKSLFSFTVKIDDTKRGVIDGVHFFRRKYCNKAWNYAIQRVFGNKISRKAESEMIYWLHAHHGLKRIVKGNRKFIIGKHIWEENN